MKKNITDQIVKTIGIDLGDKSHQVCMLNQVAIAIAAVSILTRKKSFWYVSMAFGLLGIIFVVQGTVLAKKIENSAAHQTTVAVHKDKAAHF